MAMVPSKGEREHWMCRSCHLRAISPAGRLHPHSRQLASPSAQPAHITCCEIHPIYLPSMHTPSFLLRTRPGKDALVPLQHPLVVRLKGRFPCSQAAQALAVVTSQQQPQVVVTQRLVQYREEVHAPASRPIHAV